PAHLSTIFSSQSSSRRLSDSFYSLSRISFLVNSFFIKLKVLEVILEVIPSRECLIIIPYLSTAFKFDILAQIRFI
ncbi:hypothetical protein, partial [Acidaminococcus massiliensis]